MRMSELSAATGVTVPTLKFYLREQLVHAGERTSPNQARYDETHVERVRLVRALIDVGGVSVARARDIIAALENDAMPLSSVFGVAQRAVTPPAGALSDPTEEAAFTAFTAGTPGGRLILDLCRRRGWSVHSNNPGLAQAARVLDTYSALGHDRLHAVLDDYAEAADRVAGADLAAVASAPDRDAMTNVVIVGTVLGDALLAGLRRIAQEAESFRRFPLPAGTPAPTLLETDPSC